MRKLDIESVRFRGEDGHELRVTYDNRGEPYREGVQFALDKADGDYGAHLFLEDREARELRDFLNALYPTINAPLQQIAALAGQARPAQFEDVLIRIEKIALDANKAVLK